MSFWAYLSIVVIGFVVFCVAMCWEDILFLVNGVEQKKTDEKTEQKDNLL